MADKTIKVTLVKSIIGTKQDHRATVRGLGLRRLNSSAVLEDTPAVQRHDSQSRLSAEVGRLRRYRDEHGT